MNFCLHFFFLKLYQAVKLRQSIYGEEHPVTKRTLDLFTVIYAEMGKEQYSGKSIHVAIGVAGIFSHFFLIPLAVQYIDL